MDRKLLNNMEELEIQIDIEKQKREDIEVRIQNKFSYERFPSHFEFIAIAEDIQKLKILHEVIQSLEQALSYIKD